MFDRLFWLADKFISSLQKWPLESSEKYKNSMFTIPKIGLKRKKNRITKSLISISCKNRINRAHKAKCAMTWARKYYQNRVKDLKFSKPNKADSSSSWHRIRLWKFIWRFWDWKVNRSFLQKLSLRFQMRWRTHCYSRLPLDQN